MSEQLKLRGEPVISRPVAYSFRFEHMGWAIFTVNDATGELGLQSDWGSYCHRWHTGALGEMADGSRVTLTRFLTECDGDYVARKLRNDTGAKELDNVVDEKETRRVIRERICQERREGRLGAHEARELWDHEREWRVDYNYQSSGCPADLSKFLGHEPYEYVYHKPSARFEHLRSVLFPFFRDWLVANVVHKTAVEEVAHV